MGGIIITFVELILGFIQAFLGFILIMFIPGYALTLFLYPQKEDISYVKRIGLAFVLSMISVILLVLFIDEFLAINTTPINIVAAILVFSILVLFAWKVESILRKKVPNIFLDSNFAQKFPFPAFLSAFKSKNTIKNQMVVEKNSEKDGQNDNV